METTSSGWAPEAWLAPLVIGLLYFYTALPSFGWRDSPEFADAAHTLGVAHPAGFPTFSLLTKIATFLPLGSIPFRVGLAVAFFGAAGLYLLARLIIQTAPETGPHSLLVKKWAAAAAVLVLGLTPLFWGHSTEIEVYTLNVLFLGAIIYCAVRWSAEANDAWLYAGALVYGLACGNHGAVAFFLPGLALYFFLHAKRDKTRRFSYLLFFFLAGFAVYLYLPLRAAAEPAFNFGDPETWRRFLMHVTDRKDAATHFATVRGESTFWRDLFFFAAHTTPVSFWVLGLPLLLFGGRVLWKKDRPLVMSLGLVAGANIFFFIAWKNGTAFLPALFIALFGAGVGLAWVLEASNLFSGRDAGPRCHLAALALVAAFGLGVWSNPPAWDRGRHYLSWEAFRADYLQTPPDAIVIGGVLWFHHRAYQDIFRLREDLHVMLISDFLSPQWFNPITSARFPDLAVPKGQFDRADQGEYLKKFLRANLAPKTAVYWEPFDLDNGCFFPNLEPKLELLFEMRDRPVELTPEIVNAYLKKLKTRLERETAEIDFFKEKNVADYYVSLLMKAGEIFNNKGFDGASFTLYQLLFDLFGPGGTDTIQPLDLARVLNNIATYRFNQGRLGEADELLTEALALDPNDDKAWTNLGLVRMTGGKNEEALAALQRALEINPAGPEANANLGEFYYRTGDMEKARKFLHYVLSLRVKPALAEMVGKRLKDIERVAAEGQ
ncbi:MAG: DUF2723 domain-containing protein [Pseudomonadota bacterium]